VSIVVEVQFAVNKRNKLPTKKQITHWAKCVLNGIVDQAGLTIRIVDEDEGRELNEYWRKGKKGPTNVLSFAAGDGGFGEPGYLGDVVICAPVVLREATEQGKPLQAHWAHMVIHGILHLLGYDHENKTDTDKMESLEIEKLHSLGYGNPYN
jgi:probable rRNA maturation factor